MGGCVFCNIVRGVEEAYRIYEDDVVVVILDKYPVSEGHLLVITRRHYRGVEDAEPRAAAHAFTVASALARIYRKRLGAPGVNVVTNSGRPAGQVIFHFHVHVIPRWHSGGPMWSPRHTLTPGEAERVTSRLKPHLALIREYLSRAGLGG